MARHTSSQHPTAQRALIAVATAGAALAAGAATAHAEPAVPVVDVPWRPTSLGKVDPQAGLAVLTGTVGYVTGPVAGLKPNPLAGTGVDPLDNGVGTQLADFKPIATQALTGPVAEAQSLGAVPVVGQVAGVLGAH
ncbi:hypothetical protein LK07_21870 [Streptomyces pluripotens]|uniref:ATP-binding protein n=1 Tax=Streptomyces pluripotens TaxID=1355015 RepID=A0A221P1Y7_9ACTN|nr:MULTISPECIES: hypothetical protein [Streptomyces]ARP71971.1 hypothetical protein LK06_020715 [Streptomyces pluripotens]ASN26220.1 hypothetical protein LK07_21870 [Streptomyces pluripotens]KIE26388.1 hypothetical protein LK08_14415 [Streptomyces sp. MUSC 125]MCH0556473.1 hypothetical protein [Streptomyces sp. MUM 16J]